MTMPLFVRPYLLTTTERLPSLEEIISAPLAPQTHIVMDDHFMRGCYEKIGHKMLTESDIVFPMGYGVTLNYGKEPRYRLSWGQEQLVNLHLPPPIKQLAVLPIMVSMQALPVIG